MQIILYKYVYANLIEWNSYKGGLTYGYSNQQMALVLRGWEGRSYRWGRGIEKGGSASSGSVLEGKRGFVSSIFHAFSL